MVGQNRRKSGRVGSAFREHTIAEGHGETARMDAETQGALLYLIFNWFISVAIGKNLICLVKELETELDAHESVLRTVEEMGRKLGAGLESGKDRSEIQNRLEAVSQRWKDVRRSEVSVRYVLRFLLGELFPY